MKNLIYLALTLPLLLASCTYDDMASREDIVQITFRAEIPQMMETRSSSISAVDKVYCAVFENGLELSTLRKEITIEDGKEIIFAPRLIKGRTYDIVFWASKEGAYDISDMTCITRSSGITTSEENFDAFTASNTVSVTNASQTKSITLTRPFAQLNMGVTSEDWNGVASESTFKMTPTTTILSVCSKNKFNALEGAAIGEDVSNSYTLQATGADLTCEGKTYKSIASCYVLPEAKKENFDIKYSIYDQSGNVIRENVAINAVPLESNFKTNVVGGLLTGTVTYTITLEKNYSNSEHKTEIN